MLLMGMAVGIGNFWGKDSLIKLKRTEVFNILNHKSSRSLQVIWRASSNPNVCFRRISRVSAESPVCEKNPPRRLYRFSSAKRFSPMAIFITEARFHSRTDATGIKGLTFDGRLVTLSVGSVGFNSIPPKIPGPFAFTPKLVVPEISS